MKTKKINSEMKMIKQLRLMTWSSAVTNVPNLQKCRTKHCLAS